MFIVSLHETHFHWLELMLATKFRQTKLDWFSRPPRKLEILTRQWHKFYKAHLKLEIYVICDAKVAKCITKTQIFIQNATVEKIDPSRQEKTVIQSSWSRRRRRVHSPGLLAFTKPQKGSTMNPSPTHTRVAFIHKWTPHAWWCARGALSALHSAWWCWCSRWMKTHQHHQEPDGPRKAAVIFDKKIQPRLLRLRQGKGKIFWRESGQSRNIPTGDPGTVVPIDGERQTRTIVEDGPAIGATWLKKFIFQISPHTFCSSTGTKVEAMIEVGCAILIFDEFFSSTENGRRCRRWSRRQPHIGPGPVPERSARKGVRSRRKWTLFPPPPRHSQSPWRP